MADTLMYVSLVFILLGLGILTGVSSLYVTLVIIGVSAVWVYLTNEE